jgi:hypothetical protein
LPDRRPANNKLTELKDIVLLPCILDQDLRGFAPRLASVEDMANYLLKSRGGKRVGKLWAHRFVQRRPELKTRFIVFMTSKELFAKILGLLERGFG